MIPDIRRRDFIKVASIAGVTGLAGCIGGSGGSGGGNGQQRSQAIEYGVLLPQTGDLASVGKLMTDAAKLPAAQLTDSDLGVDVNARVQDAQTSPSAAISAANSLINSGVPAICGPASSGVNIQVTKQVLIPNQVVGCSPSSTAPTVTSLEDDGYIYRTAPSDALQGQVMAQVAQQRLNASSVATLYVNNDYGQLLSQSFANAFGGEVQKQVSFEKQQPSYTSVLQQALSGNPNLLVMIGYPASGIQLFKDFYSDFGSDKADILVTDGLKDPALQKQVGNPMKNVVGTAPKASGPASSAFQKMYKEQYGTAPGVFNAHSYDAAAVLILANAMAGENSGQAVRDNMQKVANPGGTEVTSENLAKGVEMAMNGDDINYAGASSPVDFDSNGDMKTVTYSVWKFAPQSESGIKEITTIDFKKGSSN